MRPVIDANVLMHGRRNYNFDKAMTVPEVIGELETEGSKLKAETLDLQVRKPSQQSMEKVEEKVEEIFAKVSEADKALVALALGQEKTLITDDKDLQNLASHLNVEFEAYMGDKIEKQLTWKKTCSNCGREVSEPPCSHCGSTQTRRRLN